MKFFIILLNHQDISFSCNKRPNGTKTVSMRCQTPRKRRWSFNVGTMCYHKFYSISCVFSITYKTLKKRINYCAAPTVDILVLLATSDINMPGKALLDVAFVLFAETNADRPEEFKYIKNHLSSDNRA